MDYVYAFVEFGDSLVVSLLDLFVHEAREIQFDQKLSATAEFDAFFVAVFAGSSHVYNIFKQTLLTRLSLIKLLYG